MITKDDNRFRVDGPITMANARSILEQGDSLFNHGEVEVDLGAVNEVDSSAVSILLQWIREAKQRDQKLIFTNLPENLKSLVALYGVQDFISQG